MPALVLATRNPNKVREIKALFEGLPLEIITLGELASWAFVEEDQATYAGNAFKKAAAAAEVAGDGVIIMADDSGLEVEALGGLPGVHADVYKRQRNISALYQYFAPGGSIKAAN